jgi:hypothetical protein
LVLEPELEPVPAPEELPLLPAPAPPVELPLPELPVPPLEPGVVLGLAEVPPALEPPLVMPSSFKHFSRSAPTMPRHLLLVPPAALLPLLPLALGELLLGELVLGEVALGELLLDAPPELAREDALPALSDELLPVVALGLDAPLLPPAVPEAEPELCATAMPESAKSAAAVAAVMSLRFIRTP